MTRKRIALGLVALLVLAAAGAGVAWYLIERGTKDIRGSSTQEFVTSDETTTRPEQEVETEPWPIYGLTPQRTRNAADFSHRPPFRRVWAVRGRALVEFPPVIAYGRLYVANIQGLFRALDAKTGEEVWRRRLGFITAASPAVGDGIVYQPLMNEPGTDRATAPGFLLAMDAETGDELWRFEAGAVESSPLLHEGTLYFGSFDRRLHALDARTGRERWSFETGDRVKGAPAFWRGTVFTGSYDGKVYALDARTGKLRWSSEGQAGLAGAGNFYAGPAVAYGRVFIGNTDGKVYAFGARSGDLLWSQTTGSYVYSSAAVADRTVYVGSYDRRFYALDAATGDIRWSFEAGGGISGSPTVMEGLVYFATLRRKTFALDARSGEVVWEFPDGKYTPLVADREHAYLVGRNRIRAVRTR
jgi:outer membrane protein assembly factor BamB